jgi:hypothetical protein
MPELGWFDWEANFHIDCLFLWQWPSMRAESQAFEYWIEYQILKFSWFGVCENRVTVSSISHNFSFLNFYFVSVILMRKLPKWLYQQLKNLLMTWKRYVLCYSHQTSSYGNPISLQLANWIWLFYIVWLSDHCRISLSKLLLLWSGINTI